jgi:two-component system sensor histidine kinase UhpB
MRPVKLPLFWQIFLPNAAFLIIAVGVLAFTPAAVNDKPTVAQAVGLGVGLVVLVGINLLAIRRAVKPVEGLTTVISEVDPLQPGTRLPTTGGSAETAKLAEVFNGMLQRLEAERRESGRLMLIAQERERLRLARELHDEIGQGLAGLMLEIDYAAGRTPPKVREELREIRDATRQLASQLHEIVRGLRPEALDDLGLRSALVTLAKRFSDQTGIDVHRRIGQVGNRLNPDAELAIYRIGQEGLANIARHSSASEVWLELSSRGTSVVLRVADNGAGLNGGELQPGNGIRGMRERAMLVGGELRLSRAPEGGVGVELEVPVTP